MNKIRIGIGLSLKLAVLCNPGSIQFSLSQDKADRSIAWARFVLVITSRNTQREFTLKENNIIIVETQHCRPGIMGVLAHKLQREKHLLFKWANAIIIKLVFMFNP